MAHIVVDDLQAQIISESGGNIEIRNQSGRRLGFVAHDFTNDDITIAKQRMTSTEPRYTTRQVLRHLKSLELSEGLRALFAPPLRILFTVREDDRVVEVLRVGLL